jgi:hypothetical protein
LKIYLVAQKKKEFLRKYVTNLRLHTIKVIKAAMAIIIPQATNGPAIDPINVHVVWPS